MATETPGLEIPPLLNFLHPPAVFVPQSHHFVVGFSCGTGSYRTNELGRPYITSRVFESATFHLHRVEVGGGKLPFMHARCIILWQKTKQGTEGKSGLPRRWQDVFQYHPPLSPTFKLIQRCYLPSHQPAMSVPSVDYGTLGMCRGKIQ